MRAWILGGSSGLGLELVAEAKKREIDSFVLGVRADQHVDLSDRLSVDVLCKFINSADARTIQDMNFFVWNASILELAPVDEMNDLERMLDINIHCPTKILQNIFARKKKLRSPLHLITISSVASWKARGNLSAYCASKAYQAQFARALSLEMGKAIPGSKVTIAMPAGIKTNIFRGTDIDSSEFMEPADVAELIWQKVLIQKKSCDWFNVLMRDGKPIASRKNFNPELAYDELPRYNRGSSKEEAQ